MVKNHVHPESISYDDDPTPALIQSPSILTIPPIKSKMKSTSFDDDNTKTTYIPKDPKYEQHVKEQRLLATEEFKNKKFTLCFIFLIGIVLMAIGGGCIWVAETFNLKDFYIVGPGLLVIGFIMVVVGIIILIRGVLYIQHPHLRFKRKNNIVGGLHQDRAFIIDNYLIEQRLTAGMGNNTAEQSSQSIEDNGTVEGSNDRRSKYVYESNPVSPEPDTSNVNTNTNVNNCNEYPSDNYTHEEQSESAQQEQEVKCEDNAANDDVLVRSESSKRKSSKRKKKKHNRNKSIDDTQEPYTEKVRSNNGEEHIIYIPSECSVESFGESPKEKQSENNEILHSNDSALNKEQTEDDGETVEMKNVEGNVPKPAVYVSPSLDQESTVTFF